MLSLKLYYLLSFLNQMLKHAFNINYLHYLKTSIIKKLSRYCIFKKLLIALNLFQISKDFIFYKYEIKNTISYDILTLIAVNIKQKHNIYHFLKGKKLCKNRKYF